MRKIISLTIILMFIFSLTLPAFAQTNQGTIRDKIEDVRDAREDVRDVKEDIRDKANVDRLKCIEKCKNEGGQNCEARCKVADVRENVRDRREDVRDVRENVREKLAERRATAEARKETNIQRLKILKETNRAKIQDLDVEKLDRVSNLSNERLQKIAELDKRQIERLAALDIKNLDKIAELKRERLVRISKLSEEKLKRLAELDKEKLEKISDLNDSELEKVAVLGRARLKELAEKDLTRLKAELRAIKVVKIRNAGDLSKRNIPTARLAQIRERFDNAKARFEEAKDKLKEAREKLKEAQQKRDENATLEHAKAYLLRTADALINHLEKIKAKVQESENIPDDREAQIVAEIDTQITEINTIKSEIESATTKEQIKEAAKKLRAKWIKLKHLIGLHAQRVVLARVEGLVNRGLVLEKRLDNVLEKAKENGIEVDVSAEVSQFSEKIAESREKYKQAQAKLSEALDLRAKGEPADSEKIKALIDEANQLLKQSRDALKEAHDILKSIVKKIKETIPDANLSADVEVEVAQEASESVSDEDATTPCPLDAKQCPDGSYVGRVGPTCEFQSCPTTTEASTQATTSTEITSDEASANVEANTTATT